VSLSVALVYAVLMQGSVEPPPAPEGLTSVVPVYSNEDLSSGNSYWGYAHFYPRFGIQHRSQGYGYNAGYTSLDAFVPLYQDDEHWLTGFQGNVLLDNGGDFGTNLGLLSRVYRDDWDRIFGVNSFYTHRQQDGQPYHQMGVGVETLGDRFDWRMNAYFPFGTDIRRAKNSYITSAAFSGRDVLVNYLANKALAGFDTEIGGPLPASLDIVRAYVGLYHFRGSQSDSFVGVQGRLEARLNQNVHLHGGISNDKTFGTNVVFGISLWLPGYNPPTASMYGAVADRLGEDVWRNQNITIEQSPLKTPVPAIWSNGLRIDMVHVDSAAAPGGDGSFLAPVQTLTQAQGVGVPGSIIYARANSTYTGEGIVLQDQQQLLGEGIAHTIQSGYGPFPVAEHHAAEGCAERADPAERSGRCGDRGESDGRLRLPDSQCRRRWCPWCQRDQCDCRSERNSIRRWRWCRPDWVHRGFSPSPRILPTTTPGTDCRSTRQLPEARIALRFPRTRSGRTTGLVSIS
jgi:hypothetical protein